MAQVTVADRTASLVPVLADTTLLAFGGIGFANVVPPPAQAFFDLRAAGPGAAPHAEWLLAHATPAGRIYGAHLLVAWFPERAEETWRRLVEQPGQIEEFSGCIASTTTLREYAEAQLRG